MEAACRSKFNNCSHARRALLNSRSELFEATTNKKWGSGLNLKASQSPFLRKFNTNYSFEMTLSLHI